MRSGRARPPFRRSTVSRLFPDRLRAWLFPSEIFLLRETSFPKRRTVEEKRLPCDPAFGAKAWALRASEAQGGAPRLASAIDRTLIDAVKECFPAKGKAKLVSIQPQLMSRFNEWRGEVPAAGAWLVLAEADRACIALHSG